MTATPDKAVVLSIHSPFFLAREEDFNEVNIGLIKYLHDNDYLVILGYGENAMFDAAQLAQRLTGADAVEPLLPYANGTFAALPEKYGISAQRTLFIIAGIGTAQLIRDEGLQVCQARIRNPKTLPNTDKPCPDFYESRRNMEQIKIAIDAFKPV